MEALPERFTGTGFVVTCFLLLMPLTCFAADEISLSIHPPEHKEQLGKTVTFQCEPTKLDVQWYFNDSLISTNTSARMHADNTSLFISSITDDDVGNYTCVYDDSHNATAKLTLFVMPSYFIPGMIIVGINCALSVLFITCFIRLIIKTRKTLKKQKEINRNHKYQQAQS